MVLLAASLSHAQAAEWASHPPIRPFTKLAERPLGAGPHYFVDTESGSDAAQGTEETPWRTVNHAFSRLEPGDTLVLRGGIYHENVYCAVAGQPDRPITVRSYPGERAIIDGGIAEFQKSPDAAWEPFDGGGVDEYVSKATYRNIRDVIGLFADSNIGLQTYWDLESFRATDDLGSPEFPAAATGGEGSVGYCGPGLWYDKVGGRIHVRLARTHLPPLDTYQFDSVNYAGETDPRRLPLVVSPFASIALNVDQAMHVRFQDIVVRGGGYKTLNLNFGVDISFDHCLFYGGTYVVWSKGTGPLKMSNCGVYGMMAPWMFRTENVLSVYSPDKYPPFIMDESGRRHISRLPTHALLVTEGGYEFETFYYPHNHDWDISHCEFADGHDGPYLSGTNIRFHHNWVDRLQDDGVYISSPTPGLTRNVYIYENFLSAGISSIGAHSRGGPGGDIYIYRNIMDHRRPMHTNRPTPSRPEGRFWMGHSVYFRHGRGFLHGENLHFFHNTAIMRGILHAGTMWGAGPGCKARVYNNLVIYLDPYPRRKILAREAERGEDIEMDGNLHWSLVSGDDIDEGYFEQLRGLNFAASGDLPARVGVEHNAFVADPKLLKLSANWRDINDYRLGGDSPAIGKGVALPDEYADLIKPSENAPDIGALPHGAQQLCVGIDGRIVAGDLGLPTP